MSSRTLLDVEHVTIVWCQRESFQLQGKIGLCDIFNWKLKNRRSQSTNPSHYLLPHTCNAREWRTCEFGEMRREAEEGAAVDEAIRAPTMSRTRTRARCRNWTVRWLDWVVVARRGEEKKRKGRLHAESGNTPQRDALSRASGVFYIRGAYLAT